MTDAQIDDLTPELRSLLDADRDLPPVPAGARARLDARLRVSRTEESGWRGPSEVADQLGARRRWMRRGVVAAVFAAAAAVVLAFVLGRGSGGEHRVVVQPPEPAQVPSRVDDDRPADRVMPVPAAVRARKARALRFQLVEDDGTTGNTRALMAFADKDAYANKAGVRMVIDQWRVAATGTTRYDSYLRAADGTGPCAWKLKRDKTPSLTATCQLSGREILEGYLNDVYAREAHLVPDSKHEILYEQVSDQNGPYWRTQYVLRKVSIDGNGVDKASVVWNPTTNAPEVLVEFDKTAGARFGQLTGNNVGLKIAIVVNGRVASAPVIQSAIAGGRATITMGAASSATQMQREAQDLVTLLRGLTP